MFALCGRIVKITGRHGGDRCLRIIKLPENVHVDRRQIQGWHCELLTCFGDAFVMVRYFLMSRRYQARVDVVFSVCLQIPIVVLTTYVVLSCVDSDYDFTFPSRGMRQGLTSCSRCACRSLPLF